MKMAVCVPHRPSHPDRVRNFAHVRRGWDAVGIPVYTGDSEGADWMRAHAVNAACAQARDADVLLISDSDIVLENPVTQTIAACKAALNGGCYVVAFTSLLFYDRSNTLKIIEGGPHPHGTAFWQVSRIWGGVLAVPRSLYDEVGGFDERFQGYGSEDKGFLVCASTLGGPKERMPGCAFHLDHPEDDTRTSEASHQGNRLAERYAAADGDEAAIRAILAER
jgi:hypothetical protein